MGSWWNWKIFYQIFMVIFAAEFSHGFTNPQDVTAMNSLFVALGSPSLPGWIPNGGDPCTELWQGVTCVGSNISSVIINAANLGGELGDQLLLFSAIEAIDFSNNHIGGSIPSSLPPTLKNFFLSANQFTGSIPSELSFLTQLAAMSLNNNLLSGELPDSFQALTGLINLDLSGNNLSGQLPPSFENLSSLTTLRLQDNQLSGTLDVLQALPLRDLNIENNLFNGPIPETLMSIPNFKMDGNPINTTIAPSLSPSPPLPLPGSPPTLSGAPPSGAIPGRTPAPAARPGKQADGPSASDASNPATTKKSWSTKKIAGFAVLGVLLFIIFAFAIVLCLARCFNKRKESDRLSKKRFERVAYNGSKEKPKESASAVQPDNQIEIVAKESAMRPKDEHGVDIKTMGAISKPKEKHEMGVKQMGAIPKKKEEHEIDIAGYDMLLMPPPPPPPPPLPPPLSEKVIVDPIVPAKVSPALPSARGLDLPTSLRSFTIASLQQYTNSFSQENLVGGGMLGSVYRAQLPDGQLLAVKKLDNTTSRRQNEEEFLELVLSISKLRHANIVELVGYCAEHGQRLLIYEYCSNGTLYDALHGDDEPDKKLLWNARVRIALGAARALEYLHEVCQPPIVHRNFKSANVLLHDGFAVRVSDCGLAPLISSGSVSQLAGHLSAYGYSAPEFEMGTYTYQSDVFSFGVVMLELLTGRKSHDRSRPRGEQFLARWAIPQLHDIDALSRMVDPSLGGAYPSKSLSRFADIISLCVQSEPEFRPPMSEIVQNLLDMIQRKSPTERDGD